MNKLLKLFNFNKYSFSTKVILSFFAFIIIFMLIKISLSIPLSEQRALENEIRYITRSLLITKEQINVIGKSLKMQSTLEKKLIKEQIEHEVKKIEKRVENSTKEEFINLVKDSKILKFCTYKLFNKKDNQEQYKNDNLVNKIDLNIFEKWQTYKINVKDRMYRKKEYFFYNYEMKEFNTILVLACESGKLNPNHSSFEKGLKEHIHTNLLIDSSLSSTKTAFFWLNLEKNRNLDSILYEEDKEFIRKKYNVSNLSSVKNIPTGNLTIREILNIKNKDEPILHTLNGKEIFTWIIDLNRVSSKKNRYFMIAHSIDKEELLNKNKDKMLFLLPETLIAIGISFILILLLFKRVLKNINTITKTAALVNQGNQNIRSNVKGEDDIGILGEYFDSMLNFFENSIKSLDRRIEEKTKELKKSLDEKETLLKEIHHRVKNNLSLTISLIELQEDDMSDEKSKNALINIKERIYTMELLHRKLYESTNLNKIEFKTYVIDLIDTISKTYNINNEVIINIKMNDIEMNIETALPYGLILNELVTNAFKYAVTKDNKSKLEIEISKEKDVITMLVKDNGAGLKKEFNEVYNDTLGLKLIHTIVKYQLFGTIDYLYDYGAKFIIKGKLKD